MPQWEKMFDGCIQLSLQSLKKTAKEQLLYELGSFLKKNTISGLFNLTANRKTDPITGDFDRMVKRQCHYKV